MNKNVSIGSSNRLPSWQECMECPYSKDCKSGALCIVKQKEPYVGDKRAKGRPKK